MEAAMGSFPVYLFAAGSFVTKYIWVSPLLPKRSALTLIQCYVIV